MDFWVEDVNNDEEDPIVRSLKFTLLFFTICLTITIIVTCNKTTRVIYRTNKQDYVVNTLIFVTFSQISASEKQCTPLPLLM